MSAERGEGRAGLCGAREQEREKKKRDAPAHGRLIKGLTLFATLGVYGPMKRTLAATLLLLALATGVFAQGAGAPAQTERRSWFSRLNPFNRGEKLPEYSDPRLRGLLLTVEVSPQPVKLSETRQMKVKIRLTNKAKRPVTLEFPDGQRFEIFLRNSAETVLITWSDNHAFADVLGSVFINPQEHIEYSETIATRELLPNKVYTCEVFFPKYSELRVRQKFLTAP